MGHDHLLGVASGPVHAEAAPGRTEVLLARQAAMAGAAADPRIGKHAAAEGADRLAGLRPHGRDAPEDLVAEGDRQPDAALGEAQALAAAEVVMALPQVEVGVADAARCRSSTTSVPCGTGSSSTTMQSGRLNSVTA